MVATCIVEIHAAVDAIEDNNICLADKQLNNLADRSMISVGRGCIPG